MAGIYRRPVSIGRVRFDRSPGRLGSRCRLSRHSSPNGRVSRSDDYRAIGGFDGERGVLQSAHAPVATDSPRLVLADDVRGSARGPKGPRNRARSDRRAIATTATISGGDRSIERSAKSFRFSRADENVGYERDGRRNLDLPSPRSSEGSVFRSPRAPLRGVARPR